MDHIADESYVINYELEMLRQDQLLRTLSRTTNKSIEELRASSEREKQDYIGLLSKRVNKNHFFVNTPPTSEDLKEQLVKFSKVMNPDKGLIVTIDHTLLMGDSGSDKESLDNLSITVVWLKKYFDAKGLKILIILLSQLNREIERTDRVVNPTQHYPKKSDIFGASSIFFCSDYVVILHIPAKLNITFYGPSYEGYPNGLPTKYLDNNVIYLHVLKNRFGKSDLILRFLEDFEKSSIKEWI